MIEASVMRTVWNDGKTGYEVKAKGHAGAGKYGQDIVCAAVSCLMQTLANEVEEAARAGLVALGAVAHGEGWMRVEVTPTHKSCDMVEAWVELVQDGLDALAESYPENVELVVNMVFADGKEPDPAQLPDIVDGKMNLQYFAEGGGDGAAAGEGGAEAAPAVQEPALRPAQERLARRSGALRGKPTEQPPQLSGQPETKPQEGEKPTEEKPQEQKVEKTPEEKRKAFGALVRDSGEYSDIFNEVMQQAIIKAGEAVHADPKAAALRQALSEAYGIDGEDVDGLIEAVKNGSADIGLASRALKDEETAAGLKGTNVALDGIAVIVNADSKVEDLTVEQIAQGFTGEIAVWSELGGDAGAIACIGREGGSGTRDGFESITGTEGACVLSQELTSTGAVIEAVKNNPQAIGYASLAAIKDSVKALTVNGVAPTEATVKDGTYLVQRPFVLVTKEGVALSETAQKFFDFATSADAASIISAAGAVPVA